MATLTSPKGAPVHLRHLPTPSLLLDEARLRRNIARLDGRLRVPGVVLRPHCKTCKSMDVARLCMASPQGPITVSTLAEAEYFAEHGVTDICYAVGVTPGKLARALALRQRGIRLSLLLDSAEGARLLAAFARERKHIFDLLLEIDCDGHRSGLRPDDPELTESAALLAGAGQNLLGVLTHAGSAYDLPDPGPEVFAALAGQERDAAVRAAQRLREAGHACPVVSVGSTPTAFYGEDFTGVSEVRAGVYMFQDLVMAGLGVCRPEDIALSVLCTVIAAAGKTAAIWWRTRAGWPVARYEACRGRFVQEKLQPGLRCRRQAAARPACGGNQSGARHHRRVRGPVPAPARGHPAAHSARARLRHGRRF